MNAYKYKIYQYLRSIKYDYHTNPHEIFKLLLESQYWEKEKLLKFQLSEINKLLLTSLNSSNYYKELLKNISLPLKNIDEFNAKIPVITKEIIQKQYELLKTEHFCTNFKHQTGGSTGDPLTIYTSGLSESFRIAGNYRFLNWWGIKPYDKFVRIAGRRATMKSGMQSEILKKFKPKYDINVFNLNEQSLPKYFKEINNFKPVYIRGYKSAIFYFAELLEKKKLTFDSFKIKIAVVTSEVLFEYERKFIEKILNCKVVNEYGASEVGPIAHECPSGAMHIYEESVLLNTNIDNDVIVTDFHNDSMPLINYRNNDKVILSDKKCVCGRNSRIISDIEGRNEDTLLKTNGERINPIVFIYIIMELDDIGLDNCILKYKIIQNKNKFQVIILPTKKYNEKVEAYIKKRFYEEIGNEISITFSLVDEIPRDPSGKLRIFVKEN